MFPLGLTSLHHSSLKCSLCFQAYADQLLAPTILHLISPASPPSLPFPPCLSLPQAAKSTDMWDLSCSPAVWGHKVGKPGMVGPFYNLSTQED